MLGLPRHQARLLFVGLALVVSACGGNSGQGTIPASLLPATLAPGSDDASATSQGVVRLRVYAGADYRARTLGWQEELETVISQVSAIFEQQSNLRIELVDTKDWKRSGGKLEGTLKSLKSHDPGPDVDLVVGLIDAPTRHELELQELVLADTLGRHLVVRSFNQQIEREFLKLETYGLAESQEDELLSVRRRHKDTVLIAHGIAELFGVSDAVPNSGGDTVDGFKYSPSITTLSSEAARIVSINSAAHLAEDNKAEAWALAGQELAKLGADSNLLSKVNDRKEANQSSDEGEQAKGIRESDRTRLLKAKRMMAAGKLAEAWESLEPLVERYPREAEVSDAACALSTLRNSKDSLTHCTLAVTFHKEHARNWISLGSIRAETSPSLALENLQHAEVLLRQANSKNLQNWMELARAYKKLSMPSLAKKAAILGVGGESGVAKSSAVEKWAIQMRVRFGVGIGMQEIQERDYLTTLREGLELVYKQDYAKAVGKGATLSKDFPKSIGSDLLSCEVSLRRRKYLAAKRSCQAIVTRQPDNSWATYLLGVVDVRQSRMTSGIAKLEEAITRDPQLEAAYQALASVYKKSKDVRLSELQKQYQVQFGRALP